MKLLPNITFLLFDSAHDFKYSHTFRNNFLYCFAIKKLNIDPEGWNSEKNNEQLADIQYFANEVLTNFLNAVK